MQVYPPKPEDEVPLTRLQERLRKKLGANAYPFKFEVCIVYLRNRRHQIPLKGKRAEKSVSVINKFTSGMINPMANLNS